MTGLLMLGVALAQAPADEEAEAATDETSEDRERFFMPAFETGLIWSEDPNVGAGMTFRTSLEWRWRRIRAPFVRLSYDATTARFVQRDVGGLSSVTTTLTTHDILIGGGVRFGPRALQVVTSLQIGEQIAEVPQLLVDGDDLSLELRNRNYRLLVGGVGLEWYFDDDAALTLESTGRLRLRADDGQALAGGVTIGVTTSI